MLKYVKSKSHTKHHYIYDISIYNTGNKANGKKIIYISVKKILKKYKHPKITYKKNKLFKAKLNKKTKKVKITFKSIPIYKSKKDIFTVHMHFKK